jgi:hypothetical protein
VEGNANPENPADVDFVRSRRIARERVTARQVDNFHVENEHLHIPRGAGGQFLKKEFATAYSTTRHWLSLKQHKRGKQTGSIQYKGSVYLKRNDYLANIFEEL